MKQLACPSKPASSSSPARKRATFSPSTSPSKCVTEPAFEVGRSVASPSAKTFGFDRRLQRVRVGGDEAERVAEPGERST